MFLIRKSWFELLKDELTSESYINLSNWLEKEYKNKTIYPKPENVFNALNLVSFNDVKVVIIGQDPYHNPNQAHGLSFSVEKDINLPPSLQNIFKEIINDVGGTYPKDGNLTYLAKQGVLLLNSVLTVEQNAPNSHKNMGWEKITKKIISLLNERTKPVIFLAWGSNAKALVSNINTKNHYVLTANHPSPLSANRGGWFGCKHFSKTNEILRSLNEKEIKWI